MSQPLKCPNPNCPYLFDPTGVPGGVVLTCTRCAMRFTLGPPAPTAPAPIPGSPTAPATAPPAPNFERIESRPPEEADTRSRRDQMLLDRGNSSGRMTVFWVVFTLAVLLGVGITIYFRAFHTPSVNPKDLATQLRNCNIAFDPPATPWERNPDLEAKLGPPIQIAYSRTQPSAYIAVGATPFEDRNPRLSELRLGISKPLSKIYSPDTIAVTKIEGAKWLGQDANPAFAFLATTEDGRKISGECHAVSYKGVAYWSICWADELDFAAVVSEFDDIRSRFRLLKEREKWQPREAQMTTFGGHAQQYLILDAEGIWKEDRRPEDQTPPADLHLIGKIKRVGTDSMDRQLAAELWAYVIENPGGDPLAAGQQYIESLRTAEVKAAGDQYVVGFEVLTGDSESDPPTDIVEPTSAVVRLKSTVQGSRDQSRLIIVSALPMGDKLIVVRAQCDYKDHEFFELKLMQLAGSLRPSQ